MFITLIYWSTGSLSTNSKEWEILSISIVSDDPLIYSMTKSLYHFKSGRENEFIIKRILKSVAIYLHRKGKMSLPNTLEMNVKFLQPPWTTFSRAS